MQNAEMPISMAAAPMTRTTAIAPSPVAVATATILSPLIDPGPSVGSPPSALAPRTPPLDQARLTSLASCGARAGPGRFMRCCCAICSTFDTVQ